MDKDENAEEKIIEKNDKKKDTKSAIVITILLSIFILIPLIIGLMVFSVSVGKNTGSIGTILGYGVALLILVGGIFAHRAIYRKLSN